MSEVVLTVNGGSSSLKFGLFEATTDGPCRIMGKVERIGLPGTTLSVTDQATPQVTHATADLRSMSEAWRLVTADLAARVDLTEISGIGHRIVHGGPRFNQSVVVTDEVLRQLEELAPIDPTHLPSELELLRACREQFRNLRHVACFDTAFHRTMPSNAKTLPIPRRYQADGIRRYGFHGLSFAYLMDELARMAGDRAAAGKVILAHVGSGVSLAAVKSRQCLDTTMGFTPTGGVMMGTRSGDLDPGVLFHLHRTRGLSVDQLDDLVNQQSGLLGVSETSPDLRDLLNREAQDERAAQAVDLFCYQLRKAIGGFAAALGGVDTLIFAGGVGENAPVIRSRVCRDLSFLGIEIDAARNSRNAPIISSDAASVTVRVIRTNEELQIFREVMAIRGSE